MHWHSDFFGHASTNGKTELFIHMTTIEIDNKEYFVPESFDEVTIDQFAKIVSFLENERDEFTMNCGIVRILTGIDIANLPFEVGVRIFSYVRFVSGISDVINGSPIEEDFFIFQGEKYNVPKVINFITFNQYWNLDKLLEMYKGNSVLSQAAFIISMLCLKDGEEYSFALAKSRENSFKNMPSTLASRILNGFFLQSRNSNQIISLYSMGTQELETSLDTLETSIRDGNGTLLSGLFARSLVKALRPRRKDRSFTFSTTWLGRKIWTILGKLGLKKG